MGARGSLADLLGHVHRLRLHADPAAPIDPADVQQVVHQPPHAHHLRPDDAHLGQLLRAGRVAHARLQQLGIALDAGQRRPQLMTDDRQEVVLDPLRALFAPHLLLQVRPERGVVQGRRGALGNGHGQAQLTVAQPRAGRAAGGQHTTQRAAPQDRHRQQRGQTQRRYPVGVARVGVQRGLGAHRRGCPSGGAHDALSDAQAALAEVSAHPFRPEPRSVPPTSARHQPHGARIGWIGALRQEQPGDIAEQRRRGPRDRLGGLLALQRGAEFARQLAEQLCLAAAQPLALLLDQALLQLRVLRGAVDGHPGEQARRRTEPDQIADPDRQQLARGIAIGGARKTTEAVHEAMTSEAQIDAASP